MSQQNPVISCQMIITSLLKYLCLGEYSVLVFGLLDFLNHLLLLLFIHLFLFLLHMNVKIFHGPECSYFSSLLSWLFTLLLFVQLHHLAPMTLLNNIYYISIWKTYRQIGDIGYKLGNLIRNLNWFLRIFGIMFFNSFKYSMIQQFININGFHVK